MSALSYGEAIGIGVLQGVTELFPVSSLGHSVLVPALVGGSWARDLNVSAPESPYLAFIVGLHVATAAALACFYWRDWSRIISGFLVSLRHRRVREADERLAWLLVLATIPVGVTGLLLEHLFRTTLGRPVPAAGFLMLNGAILIIGERLRRRSPAGDARADAPVHPAHASPVVTARHPVGADQRLSRLTGSEAVGIGAAQTLALLPGVSRSGSPWSPG